MGDYSGSRATATKLLTKFGKSITLNREVDGVFYPTTGGTETTSETATGVGVLLNFKNSEIDGTSVLSSDKKLIYSGEEPLINDRYIDYRVTFTDPLDPDESGAIIYTCGLRK
jgi:hypothetical protein